MGKQAIVLDVPPLHEIVVKGAPIAAMQILIEGH